MNLGFSQLRREATLWSGGITVEISVLQDSSKTTGLYTFYVGLATELYH